MNNFTPGPWEVREREPWVISKAWGNLKSVVHLNYPPKPTPEQAANAKLMAAAPDMLAALEAVDKLLTRLAPSPEYLDDEDESEAVDKEIWLQVQQAIERAK